MEKQIYYWDQNLEDEIRYKFDEIGAKRLSDHLSKAKGKYKASKTFPKWIAENHWNSLLQHWEKEDMKKISKINSKNRLSSSNNNGPSVHTGGSRPLEEYFDHYVEKMGVGPTAPELFMMTHHSKKKNDWCGLKSKFVMEDYRILKRRKPQENGYASNANNGGVEDDMIENDILERGEDYMTTEPSLDHEVEFSLWTEAVGGSRKRRIYGLGVRSSVVCPLNNRVGSSKASIGDYSNKLEFEEAVQREIDKRMGDMRAMVQEVVQQEVQAAVKDDDSSTQ